MRKIKFLDAGVQVILADMQRHNQEIVSECLKVWDSMRGKLPGFQGFVRMYVKDGIKRWMERARWN